MRIERVAVLLLAGATVASPLAAQTSGPSPKPPALPGSSVLVGSPGAHPEDGRRTLDAFHKNLGRNLVGVFSTDNLVPLLVGASATGVGSLFDHRAQGLLQDRVPGLGRIGQTAGGVSVVAPLAGGLFLAGRFSSEGRFRAATYDLAQAFLVNAAWTTALKEAVRRPRPDGSNSLSFPSGHTSNAFAWATVAYHHYGAKVGLPFYLAASAIGVSRIENDKHHLSDVLAGATLGYIVGRTVVREDGVAPAARRPRLSLTPASDASGNGVGVGLSYAW